jgi:hypothetical protein
MQKINSIMNKYYLRFNPESRHSPEIPNWTIETISNGKVIDRNSAFNVTINTDSKTECNKNTARFPNWWNITCNGYLQIDSAGNATINSHLPVSGDNI